MQVDAELKMLILRISNEGNDNDYVILQTK